MSDLTVAALEPGVFFLAAVVVCLILEAAGAPIGARKRGPRTHLALLLLVACGCAVAHSIVFWSDPRLPVVVAAGGVALDRLSLVGTALVGVLAACSVITGAAAMRAVEAERGETYGVCALVALSLAALVSAADLVVVSVALTLLHVVTVCAASIDRESPQGIEAGVKALAAGMSSTAFSLFATALAYGASSDVSLAGLGRGAAAGDPLALAAVALVGVVVLGLLGVVPLHSPSVDIGQGSLPFASSLVSAGRLVAGASIALRVVVPLCAAAPSSSRAALLIILQAAAAITLVAGPLAAVDQSRVSRMVAYLVTTQGGFVLVGLAAAVGGARSGIEGALLTAVTSALAVTAAWFGAGLLPRAASTWEDWSGFGRRHPILAVAFLVALASLGGLPGTAGFVARAATARAAFDAGSDVLAILAIVAPALAMASALRLGIFLFGKLPHPSLASRTTPWQRAVLVALGGLLIVVGFWPEPLAALVRGAAER